MRRVRAIENRERQTESGAERRQKCGVRTIRSSPNSETQSLLERSAIEGESPVETTERAGMVS